MKKNRIKLSVGYRVALTAIIFAFIAVLVMNILMVRRAETERAEAEGQMRLSNIAARQTAVFTVPNACLTAYQCR